jgi:hypothetical protein
MLSKLGVYFAMLHCPPQSAHLPTLILGVKGGVVVKMKMGVYFENAGNSLQRRHRSLNAQINKSVRGKVKSGQVSKTPVTVYSVDIVAKCADK